MVQDSHDSVNASNSGENHQAQSTKTSSKITVDADAVRQLADLFKENDLTEIEYETEGCRIRVARTPAIVQTSPMNYMPSPAFSHAPVPSSSPEPSQIQPSATVKLESHPGTVKSPMVGTLYLAPKPDSPNFIEIGTIVTEGQTLMIIEAMKVMNPLKSPRSGKVIHIFAEDAHPVEYDEPLLIIE